MTILRFPSTDEELFQKRVQTVNLELKGLTYELLSGWFSFG
jgi:hypothetical protein